MINIPFLEDILFSLPIANFEYCNDDNDNDNDDDDDNDDNTGV